MKTTNIVEESNENIYFKPNTGKKNICLHKYILHYVYTYTHIYITYIHIYFH